MEIMLDVAKNIGMVAASCEWKGMINGELQNSEYNDFALYKGKLVQSHGAFWGVFKNWGFNPQFLKAFSGAEASDLSIRWLQASTGTFQKMRIESSILENSPKSPMGWDYHPFFGGKNPKKKWPNFFYVLMIHIKNTFCKKIGPKRSIQPSVVT